jgi:3'(2'), 5'-bisphosphate nucleotidase
MSTRTQVPGFARLDDLTTLVSEAAAAILSLRSGALAPRTKPDGSQVTAADETAEAIMLAGLGHILPSLPVVSEEAYLRASPGALGDTFVLLDPLDGTSELLAGRDEFTVNLAIVAGGRACFGIVGAPALGLVWRTTEGGAERLVLAAGMPAAAARRDSIHTRPWPAANRPVAVVSRSHRDAATMALLARIQGINQIESGSSVKFCQLAEGTADFYPRLAPTHEWDVAAGDAVLNAAGGAVIRPDGQPLRYGGQGGDFVIPAFLAWGDPAAPAQLGVIGAKAPSGN